MSVSYDPLDFPAPTATFTYYTPPRVVTVVPTWALTDGGTAVNVSFAAPLPPTAALLCAFNSSLNSTLTPPVQVGGQWVTCAAPAVAAVTLTGSLLLVVDGVGTRAQAFSWVARPTLTAVYPPSYLNDQPQTLYLQGSSFAPSAALHCLFTDDLNATTAVPALWLTTQWVTCGTPASALGSEWLEVAVSNVGEARGASAAVNVSTPAMALTALVPPAGPTLPFNLSVQGVGFVNSSALACVIDATAYPALYLSPTDLTCATNGRTLAGEAGRTLVVRVRAGTGNVSVSSLPYTPTPPIQLQSLTPRDVGAGGGAPLTLTGANFPADATCAFDCPTSPPYRVTSLLTSYSPSQVTCASPDVSAVAGLTYPVVLGAAVVSAYFASNPLPLTARTPAVILSLSPAVGYAGANTSITVTGTGFTPTLPPVFYVAGIAAPSIYLSPTTLLLPMPGWAVLPAFTTNTGLVTTAGCPSLPITLGLQDTSGVVSFAAPLTYTYFNASVVLAMAPTAGGAAGGTVVAVSVSSVYAATVRCRFDVQAVWPVLPATPTSVQCVAPAHTPGVVAVALSINGREWVPAGQFTYYVEPRVDSLTPSTALPAPPYSPHTHRRRPRAALPVPGHAVVQRHCRHRLYASVVRGSQLRHPAPGRRRLLPLAVSQRCRHAAHRPHPARPSDMGSD